jgi:glycosyltransferase involved in cell wall biosynthesis
MGYMSPGNELATLLGFLLRARVVWNLRSAQLDLGLYDWLPRAFFRVGARLSSRPDAIVVNSEAGRRHFGKHGYRTGRMRVISNGIDTTRFAPRREAGLAMRRAWGIDTSAPVAGLVARIDPIKGHDVFLAAARRVLQTRPDARFVCIGGGDPALESRLRTQATALGLGRHVVWPGQQADMTAAYSALDVAVSASRGEGLPNTVAEAMACGVPCVVTDVGDSALLVGETGLVVPAGDVDALAGAIREMLACVPDGALSEACRRRIIEAYGTERLGREMVALLNELVRGRPASVLSTREQEDRG